MATQATASGSSFFPFCPVCSTILDVPEGDEITCTCCQFKCQFANLAIDEVITRSAPKPKPNWVGEKDGGEDDENNAKKHAVIEEPCPKCGHPELYFYTMQLRSVDEGSTVFYECPSCKHTYSQNN